MLHGALQIEYNHLQSRFNSDIIRIAEYPRRRDILQYPSKGDAYNERVD